MEKEKTISLSKVQMIAEINGINLDTVKKNFERKGFRVTSGGGDKLHWETVKGLKEDGIYRKENGGLSFLPLQRDGGTVTLYYKGRLKAGKDKKEGTKKNNSKKNGKKK